ncbi:hypothetical protein [Streptomyces sp. NPDC097981]|uniref:hypothetical protein n=1 Tax=Streptomyces sp. NPDC097981 TaxID=3155428 RepID=UPI0033201865
MPENELIEAAERALNEATVGIVERHPELQKPIAGWDGERRTWVLSYHESGGHLYGEVVASIVTAPYISYDAGLFRLDVSARGWSDRHRRTPMEVPVFSVVISDADDVPSVEVLDARLDRGLGIASELASKVEVECKERQNLVSNLPIKRA